MIDTFEHACEGCGLKTKVAAYRTESRFWHRHVVMTAVWDDLFNGWDILTAEFAFTRLGANHMVRQTKRYILGLEVECSPDISEEDDE